MMHFRLDIEPPTVTAQMKGEKVVRGRVIHYELPEVKKARRIYQWYLWQNRPEKPMHGAIMLKTVWTWTIRGKHKDGEYKTTKPDTDNHIKLFKDAMTQCGFWKDDSQVVYETTVKMWGTKPGIEVMVCELGDDAE